MVPAKAGSRCPRTVVTALFAARRIFGWTIIPAVRIWGEVVEKQLPDRFVFIVPAPAILSLAMNARIPVTGMPDICRRRLRCGLAAALTMAVGICGCKKAAPPPPPPAEVQVVTVTPRDVPIVKEWIGSLDGFVNAQIHAQVTGYLLTQNYVEGSDVKKGDLLFQIDPRPFQALLDQANAKLALDEAQRSRTKWDVERYAPLAKQNAISQQEYIDAVQSDLAAEAQVKADTAAVDSAKLNLEFTRIISPIDGLAGIALAQIGDLVGPSGTLLTTVSTVDPIKVFFPVSEQDYLAYRRQHTNALERASHEQGLSLQLILADGSIYPTPGRFYFAGREVNLTTGTLQLAGLFPNPDRVLRPGQFAHVRAETQIRKGALLVPQRAVTELQGSYQIATVDAEDKAHIRPVTVGERIGSEWIIEQGIQSGERVVVEGTQKVKEGVKVNWQKFPEQTRN
jgi:RND family efflux transporter MFP subunit